MFTITRFEDLFAFNKDVTEAILERFDVASYCAMRETGLKVLFRARKWLWPAQFVRKRDTYLAKKYVNWCAPVCWEIYQKEVEEKQEISWASFVASQKNRIQRFRALMGLVAYGKQDLYLMS